MVFKYKQLQRAVFWWIDYRSNEKLKAATAGGLDDEEDLGEIKKRHNFITAEEVAMKYGVPRDDFVEYLEAQIEAAESCQSLPFTLLLVVSYCMMVINHMNAPMVNAVEDSISFDITENANFAFSSDYIGHKNIDDVNSLADFWSWMNRGFLPLIFIQQYGYAEGHDMSEPYILQVQEEFPRDTRGTLLHYNRIILGVRMSQERDTEDLEERRTCDDPSLQPLYNKDCVGGLGYELEPEVMQARRTANRMREHWIYIHDNQEFVRQQLVQMEKQGWLDEHTKKIELAIPVYNAEYGLHSMIMCDFFFSRGGHIWKAIIPLSAFATMFATWFNFVSDGIWLFCTLVIVVTEGRELKSVISASGFGGIVKEYIGLWNGIDWLSVFAGWGLIGMLYINITNLLQMNTALEELGRIDEAGSRSEYRDKGKEYVTSLENEIHFYYTFKVYTGLYPLVIVLRLFKAFGSQPRLAVVTNTLASAAIDLAHFLIIFMSVFTTYMVAGVVLFGREAASFSTTFRATITCFRMLFGDFDWDEMAAVGRADAFIWFLPFALLIMMLLLNMLIAIVMDAYGEVVSGLENEDTIMDMAKKAYKQRTQRGDDIALSAILHRLRLDIQEKAKLSEENVDDIDLLFDPRDRNRPLPARVAQMPKEGEPINENEPPVPMVKVQGLTDLFTDEHRLRTMQAKVLIRDAVLAYYHNHKETADVDEIIQLINVINFRTKLVKRRLRDMVTNARLASHHPHETCSWAMSCYAELKKAREDLDGWLLHDPDDVRLRLELLNLPKGENGESPDTMQVIADEHHVLQRCRAAGISSKFDDKRRRVLGQVVQIVEQDDRDGTVHCLAPALGGGFDVWLPMSVLVPVKTSGNGQKALKDIDGEEGSTTLSDKSGIEKNIQQLDQELQVGRDTVVECLKAVEELHGRLQKARSDKKASIEKFQEVRKKAVALTSENRSQRERQQQSEMKMKILAEERDRLFEKARVLAEENRELEGRLQAASWHRR